MHRPARDACCTGSKQNRTLSPLPSDAHLLLGFCFSIACLSVYVCVHWGFVAANRTREFACLLELLLYHSLLPPSISPGNNRWKSRAHTRVDDDDVMFNALHVLQPDVRYGNAFATLQHLADIVSNPLYKHTHI